MAKYLVIVESPAKSRTINKFLGDDYEVKSSMGHIVDLPATRFGVDIDNGFEPTYELIRGKKKIVDVLKKAVKGKECIYLAPDPDREGEAISWHLKTQLSKAKKVARITFNEITKDAVLNAVKAATEIDMKKVSSQQARRILDRIVGYKISPILWRKITRGLSAGRVQSIALRLIVERDCEIKAFKPKEYWQLEALLSKLVDNKEPFTASLEKIKGKKAEIATKSQIDKIVKDVEGQKFIVDDVKKSKKSRNPTAPFTTSKLQQEAFTKLGFSVNRTMTVAQQLYEGIELEGEDAKGLITYMRTDSVRVSNDAALAAKEYIIKRFGDEYYPKKPNIYKSKKSAQEAHECIRPTLPFQEPESLASHLNEDQLALYKLIWEKFLASQMAKATFDQMSVLISAGDYTFKTTGAKLIFKGFLILASAKDEKDTQLPALEPKEELKLNELKPSQHFTKPPPRYSDASLVKTLEENGVGRPSTYAPTIGTLIARRYCIRDKGYFSPTELGIIVSNLLVEHFPKVFDIGFTAQMEEELDRIEEGDLTLEQVLKDFYGPFEDNLKQAVQNMKNLKKEAVTVDENCPECKRQLIMKWGRRGKFLSCSGFPKCKYSKSISTGVKCPEEGCDGDLIQRYSRRGPFYGCSNFPKCKHTERQLPSNDSSEKKENT